MNADTLLENFEILVETPCGIGYLKELVIEKAIRGQLVSHEPRDHDQIRHLVEIRSGKGEILKAKVAGRTDFQRIPLESEFPFEKPSTWEFARIDDTGNYINGCAFKAADQADNGLPIIRIQNLTNAAADFNFTRLKLASKNIAEPGDLLVSWSATLDAFKWQGERGAVNQHIFKVEPFNSVVESDFLYLILKWAIRRLANSDALHGLAMKHINRGSFISSIVPIPPLAEQRKIIAKVDELMALCDQLEQQQKQRDNLHTATRKSAIDAISTATTPEELETAWKRINNNWEVIADTPESVASLRTLILSLAVRGQLTNTLGNAKRIEESFIELGSVLTLEYGKPLDKSLRTGKGSIPVYGANGVKAMTAQSLVKERGIVVGRKGSAGEVNMTEGPFWPLDVTFFAKFEHNIFDLKYLYYLLKSLNLPQMARGIKPGINRNDVNKLKVLSVDLVEQKRIVAKVDELMALCDQLEVELKVRSEVAEKFARSVVSAA